MRRTVVSFAALLTATLVRTATAAELEFDHVWIVVSRDAPERAALERAGLKISPDVNRHDGQGTASISAEFLNAYLELIGRTQLFRLHQAPNAASRNSKTE